jgi:hypothetical protein
VLDRAVNGTRIPIDIYSGRRKVWEYGAFDDDDFQVAWGGSR